jgi:hypothetical protein
MTQLKDGQRWKTRGGGETTLTYQVRENWFRGSLDGWVYGDDEGHTTEGGRMVFGLGGAHDCDLMELIEE